MKKTKLLSLIMAAALVLTSLPVMMLPVSADAEATLTVGESITIPTDSADGWSSGVNFFSEKYTSVKVRGAYGINKTGKNLITLYDHENPNDSIAELNTSYTVVYKVRRPADTNLQYDSPKIIVMDDTDKEVKVTNDWKVFSYGPFMITDSTKNTAFNFEIPDKTGKKYSYFDFAGIQIYETADPNEVIYAWGCYANPNVWTDISVYDNIHVSNEYLFADLTANGASYDLSDVTLLPGVYQLSGKFSTDAGTADLTVKANDTAMNYGATTAPEGTVGTESTALTYTLTIAEEMTLSELSFDWTANGAATLTLSDLEFKCIELTGATINSSIKRGTLVANPDSVAYWTTEDTDASIETDFSDNYVTANVRSGISKGFTKVKLYDPADAENSLCTPGKKYTVTYWVKLNENAEQNSNFYTFVNTTYGSTSGTPQMTSSKRVITYDWQEISRSFTQDDRIAYLNAYIRGINLETGESLKATDDTVYTQIDIRGIKMVDVESGENVFAYGIYDETLKPSQWTFPVIMSGKASITKHTDLSELSLIPSDSETTFNYDASSKNITLAPGKYVVKGNFAAAKGSQNVKLIAYTEDGAAVVGETTGISTSMTPVSVELDIESTTTLTGVSVVIDGGTTVYAGEIRISQKGSSIGKPYVGVIMGLLLKRREKPTLSFERTNLLTNAIKEVGTVRWSIADQTLAVGEDEEYGQFLRFSGITKNTTGFTYTDGRELVPGTYELSGAIRTAVKGQKAIQRVFLNGIQLGMMNITNAWLPFRYTVVLTEAGVLKFKASGAPGAANIKDYDIAKLKLIHVEEDPKNLYEIPVPMGDPAAIFTDSLLPNIFTEIGSDAWSVNGQTLTLKKDEDLYYAVMSDLADDNVGFTYNSGAALAPGKYVLTFDARTEGEGAESAISIFSSGVKLIEENITDQWTTFTVEFLVEEGRTVTLKFAGGGTAEGLVDYSIANVKVTAK